MIDLTADVDNLKIQNFEIERKILIERLKKMMKLKKILRSLRKK